MSRSCQSRSCCLLDVLEIVIDSVMDPTFHMTASHMSHVTRDFDCSVVCVDRFMGEIRMALVCTACER